MKRVRIVLKVCISKIMLIFARMSFNINFNSAFEYRVRTRILSQNYIKAMLLQLIDQEYKNYVYCSTQLEEKRLKGRKVKRRED